MALSSTYDAIFNQHRNRVPLNYMKALAKRESNFNPGDTQGPAWGLMQIVEVVRNGWNKRYPQEAIPRNALLEPDTNVRVASDLLNRIIVAYGKHPDQNLKENWRNPEFVKLVTAGWNSGYSEGGGVGCIARFLESRRIPVTHDNVFAYAPQSGCASHLFSSAKQNWQRGVADLFYAEGGPGNALLPFLVIGGLGYLAYRML